jgi:acetoin utilization deacetylase AcuC-like enzyme
LPPPQILSCLLVSITMLIVHDSRCTAYGSYLRPEQPARLLDTAPFLRERHPDWIWREPAAATPVDAALAHSEAHLKRLQQTGDFDADTPWFEDIADHAYRATGAAMAAADAAVAHPAEPAIALMRPPGHHATAHAAMGFCYLNHIAIAALHARARHGLARVAVWDFDAHHGNGTEAILAGREGFLVSSVHQFPGYPGTGTTSFKNCYNWPIAPHTPAADHMHALRESLDRVIAFAPDLVMVSAGFDAFIGDPITAMTLETNDFATLGHWLHDSRLPAAAVLEGGYSLDLPQLVETFLAAWAGEGSRS